MTLFEFLGIDYIDNDECEHEYDYFVELEDGTVIQICRYCEHEEEAEEIEE